MCLTDQVRRLTRRQARIGAKHPCRCVHASGRQNWRRTWKTDCPHWRCVGQRRSPNFPYPDPLLAGCLCLGCTSGTAQREPADTMAVRSASGTLGGIPMKHLSLVTVCASPYLLLLCPRANGYVAHVPKLCSHLGTIALYN